MIFLKIRGGYARTYFPVSFILVMFVVARDHILMKKLILILLFFGVSFSVSAQSYGSGRWVLGGSLGAGLDDYEAISISPQIGYRLSNRLTTGFGISYSYYQFKDEGFKLNYAGMNTYIQFNPIPCFKFFVQPELIRRWGEIYGKKDDGSVFGGVLVGGGLVLRADDGEVSLNLYWDVVHKSYKNKVMCSIGYMYHF